MRIVHVIPSIEQRASGPSYSVPSLSRAMRRAGVDSQVISIGRPRDDADTGTLTFPRRPFPYRLGRSPEMHQWLQQEVAADAVQIIHNHSIWMMPNVYSGWSTKNSGVPLIVSPHGTFSVWALRRSRAVKLLFWTAVQRGAIAHAALFHATSEGEYADIRRLGYRQPVAVIPNGVDIPKGGPEDHLSSARTLLFIGRLHQVKGVDILLRAWARIGHRYPNWRLRIVGPGEEDYVRHLSELAASLAVERVTFTGPLYGADIEHEYRAADLLVLPSHSENFGMVVAEALAAGCPVVVTKNAPWSGLVDSDSGWWIETGVEPLGVALDEAMSKETAELRRMGANGRAWMARDFSWDEMTARMMDTYSWVRSGGAVPSWVRRD